MNTMNRRSRHYSSATNSGDGGATLDSPLRSREMHRIETESIVQMCLHLKVSPS
jgi:hypothetical protein